MTPRLRPSLDSLLLAFVCLVALALRLHVLAGAGFDGLYGQDAYAYADFAERLSAALAHGEAIPPFYWPLGYPALLGLVFAVSGGSIAAAQAVGLLIGVALSAIVYLLARECGCRPWSAALAGLIVAVGGQAIQSSVVLMSDIPALFWASLSALGLMHYGRTGRGGLLALAAVALVCAVVTRWIYLGLVPVWIAALIAMRARLRHLGIAALCALPIVLAQTAYSLNNPYPALDHPWVIGWSPANALRSTFDNADGHFEYATTNAAFYAQPVYAPIYLSPWLAPLVAVGVYALLWRKQWALTLSQRRQTPVTLIPQPLLPQGEGERKDLVKVPLHQGEGFRVRAPLPLTLLALGWLLLPYAFLAGTPYQNIRFPLIVVPAVALLAALGLEALLTLQHRVRRFALALALIVCTVGLGQMIATGVDYTRAFIARQSEDKQVIAWLETQLPPDARVYALGLALPLRRYTRFEPRELYDQTPETLAGARDGATDYLLINRWQIENQWRGLSPEIAVRWLRETRGLDEIGRYGNFTLYEVRP
ncbi:MAG: phospholipid carrier-dependent glycosyltransferase [Anaerolineae bacterium]|nr:phospholipid carrier-dependent glycosyltransferase [Anaerolineae bacterium]